MVAPRRVSLISHRPTMSHNRAPKNPFDKRQKNRAFIRSCRNCFALVMVGAFIGNVLYGISAIVKSETFSNDVRISDKIDNPMNRIKYSNIGTNEDGNNGQSKKQQVRLDWDLEGEDRVKNAFNPVDDNLNDHANSDTHASKMFNPHKQQNSRNEPSLNTMPPKSKDRSVNDTPHSGDQLNTSGTNDNEKLPQLSKATSKQHTNPDEKQANSITNKLQNHTVSPNDLYKLFNGSNITQEEFVKGFNMLRRQSIPTSTTPNIMITKQLPDHKRERILVTGGAGFVGSHLVDRLMMEGHEVIVMDNFFTGHRKNVEHWMYHPNFSLIVHDVTEPIFLEVDQIYHLACPASPSHYQYNPVKTIKTSTQGTLNMLGLAKRVKARMLLASTSEIYGDPTEHPQPETYWGNVNTIGPRSCYDEGKRVAETMMYAYRDQSNVDIRIARIFNTFGPRMHPNDGRVVSNFIIQALQGIDLTIYGSGEQSRSFQFVSDLVEGLYSLMNSQYDLPVNLGNPDEYTIKRFAEHIKNVTNSESEIKFLKASKDDPRQRRPLITTAKEKIGWEPRISVDDGLDQTIEYFKRVLSEQGMILPTGPGAAKPKVWSG